MSFLYKVVLGGIQNSRNFHDGRSEPLACFETQSSSEVFEEFTGGLVFNSQENNVFKWKFMYVFVNISS